MTKSIPLFFNVYTKRNVQFTLKTAFYNIKRYMFDVKIVAI